MKPFIYTSSGVRFEFPPKPDQVRLEDISWALDNICRYGGHSLRHYSVAEHMVRGARLLEVFCPPRSYFFVNKHWLLHDSAEAYSGDICKPIKTKRDESRENKVLAVIYVAAGRKLPNKKEQEDVKVIDELTFFAETQVVCHPGAAAYHKKRYETWLKGQRWPALKKGQPKLEDVVSIAFPKGEVMKKSFREEYESLVKLHKVFV